MILPPQTRQLIPDYDKCVALGGGGGDNPCKRAWGSLHGGGIVMNFVYVDGSVRSVSTGTDMVILAALSTVGGGEVVGTYD